MDANAVTLIALERNCFRCPAAGLLELRRDGSAAFSQPDSGRFAGAGRVSRGTVRQQDFLALARLLVAKGFFGMQDVYQAADLADGAWVMVSARAGPMDKRVFSREDAGPSALRDIEVAIDAVMANIVFQPPP